MAADADAFRGTFRTLAADPFAFSRGSACLFYADLAAQEDPWCDERTSRGWIPGDLQAEPGAGDRAAWSSTPSGPPDPRDHLDRRPAGQRIGSSMSMPWCG